MSLGLRGYELTGQEVSSPDRFVFEEIREGLLAEIEFLDDGAVARGGCALEVIKQTATLGDEFEQTAAGRVVLGVGFEMLGEKRNSLRKERDLNICAAGVFVVEFQCIHRICCCFGHLVFLLL